MLEMLNVEKHLLGLGRNKKGEKGLKKESGPEGIKTIYYKSIYLYIYIYIHIHKYLDVYIYIHMHIHIHIHSPPLPENPIYIYIHM